MTHISVNNSSWRLKIGMHRHHMITIRFISIKISVKCYTNELLTRFLSVFETQHSRWLYLCMEIYEFFYNLQTFNLWTYYLVKKSLNLYNIFWVVNILTVKSFYKEMRFWRLFSLRRAQEWVWFFPSPCTKLIQL